MSAADVPIYDSETEALQAELNGAAGAGANGGRPDAARVIVLMCHEDRDGVFDLLRRLGARPVDVASELTELVPRMQGRPRRGVSAADAGLELATGHRSRRGHQAPDVEPLREMEERLAIVRQRDARGARGHASLTPDLGLGRLERPRCVAGSPSMTARPCGDRRRTARSRSVRNASSEPAGAKRHGPDRPVASVEDRPPDRARSVRSERYSTQPASVVGRHACPVVRQVERGPRGLDREPAPGVEAQEPDPAPAAAASRRSGR